VNAACCQVLTLLESLVLGSLGCLAVKWIVNLAVYPQSVQQHRKFARNGNECALLRILSASCHQALSVPAQVAIRPMNAQDVVRTANQQSSKQRVTGS